MIKQVINVHHKKFATGLFWQPLGVGNTPQNYAKQLAKSSDKKYTLFVGYKSMVGLASVRDGASAGMPSAAVEIVNSLSELISFLGVFQTDGNFYLVAVRNGVIIRDILLDNADMARKLYVQLSELPDWGALFAPAAWGMPKSQERHLSELIGKNVTVKLRQISVVKSVLPSVFFGILFAVFGFYVITQTFDKEGEKSKINPEAVKEYKHQIELKKQQIFNKNKGGFEESIDVPYNHLPNAMERAKLCYKAIAFVMQPVPGWNQTYAKCDEDFVSVTFSRDFGTLNDFYEVGAVLMPGAMTQEMSEDEIILRVKLPELQTYFSLDNNSQSTVVRDITTIFQQAHIKADIQGVTDTVVNDNKTKNLYITEVAAASKLIPSEFMQAFKDFGGVYMTSVVWRANTRTWNYEVIIYSK